MNEHEEKEPEYTIVAIGGERSEMILGQVLEAMAIRKEMKKLQRKMGELSADFTAKSKKVWGQIYDWHEDLDLTNPQIHSMLVGPDDKKITECKEGDEIFLKYFKCEHDHSGDDVLRRLLGGMGGSAGIEFGGLD